MRAAAEMVGAAIQWGMSFESKPVRPHPVLISGELDRKARAETLWGAFISAGVLALCLLLWLWPLGVIPFFPTAHPVWDDGLGLAYLVSQSIGTCLGIFWAFFLRPGL